MSQYPWQDEHILYDNLNSVWIAYDEAGLEYSRYTSKQEARDALELYAEVLEKRADSGVFS